MWVKSNNGESTKPAEVEICQGGVIVRKNFHLIEATDEMPEHWEYEEWQMTKDQYDVYQVMLTETGDIEDALIELAEIIAGGE